MADILSAIILALAGGLTLTALVTLLAYLLPSQVERTRAILEAAPRRAFVIGLVNFIFFGLLAAFGAERAQVLRIMAVFIVLALSGLSTLGLTAVMHLLRQRIYGSRGVGDTLKTAVLLIGAGLTPVVGWFVLAPILLITGLGAVIIAQLQTPPASPEPDPDEMEPLPY